MKSRILIGLGAALMISALGRSASAALLFQRTLLVDRSTNVFASDEFDLDLVLGDSFLAPSNPVTLFDSLEVSTSNAGDRFVAEENTDAAFTVAANRLSDARNEFVRLIFTETSSGRAEQRGWAENAFFGLGVDTPDLAGSTIESIELTIDQFALSSSGGSGPPVQLVLTVSIFGIPEPTGMGLLLMGLAAGFSTAYLVNRPGRVGLASSSANRSFANV